MATYDDATRVQSTPQMPGKPMTTPINRDQRTAIVAAGGGTAALGGAAYALSRLEDGDREDQATNDANGNGIPDDQEKPPVAPTPELPVAQVTTPPITDANGDGIDDSLQTQPADPEVPAKEYTPFEIAFMEARNEQGPGGMFVFEGEPYTTYHQEEWDGMNAEQKDQYLVAHGFDVHDDGGAGGAGSAGGGAAEAYAANDALEVTPDNDVMAMAPDKEATDGVTVLDPNAPDPDSVPVATNTDDSIIMLDPNTPDPDSVPVVAGSEEPSISVVTLDGHEMALIDTDHDNQSDIIVSDDNVVLIDTDGDHKFDTQAMYNAETHQLENVQTLDNQIDTLAMNDRADDAHLANNTHDMDMGMDFNSHADVSDFAL